MTAFFRPHASGTHTFFVTNDDNAELFLAPGNNITATDSNRYNIINESLCQGQYKIIVAGTQKLLNYYN